MTNPNNFKTTSWWLSMFDNHSIGVSARKFSAFIAIYLSVYLSVKYTSTEILSTILTIWLLFALLCLAIISFQQIIELKNGSKEVDKTPEIPT